METSDSDNDHFESADEGFSDEESKLSEEKCTSELHSPTKSDSLISSNISDNPNFDITDINDDLVEPKTSTSPKIEIQYRKRPERSKQIKTLKSPSLEESPLQEDRSSPVKSDSSVLSKLPLNFNQGLHTIQQTSSSIKEFVLTSIPKSLNDQSKDDVIWLYNPEARNRDLLSDDPELSKYNRTEDSDLVKESNKEVFKIDEDVLTEESREKQGTPEINDLIDEESGAAKRLSFVDTLAKLSNEISELNVLGQKILGLPGRGLKNESVTPSDERGGSASPQAVIGSDKEAPSSEEAESLKDETKEKSSFLEAALNQNKPNIISQDSLIIHDTRRSECDISLIRTESPVSDVHLNKVPSDIQTAKNSNETKSATPKTTCQDSDIEIKSIPQTNKKIDPQILSKSDETQSEGKETLVEEDAPGKQEAANNILLHTNEDILETDNRVTAERSLQDLDSNIKELDNIGDGWHDEVEDVMEIADRITSEDTENFILTQETINDEDIITVESSSENIEIVTKKPEAVYDEGVLEIADGSSENLGNITEKVNEGWDDADFEDDELSITPSVNSVKTSSVAEEKPDKQSQQFQSDGWDDADFEDIDDMDLSAPKDPVKPLIQNINAEKQRKSPKFESDGWDDAEINLNEDVDNEKETESSWDDWGDEESAIKDDDDKVNMKQTVGGAQKAEDKKVDWDERKMEATRDSNSWGWGNWGVNSLLSTATAVTQGISSVLEAGVGAPSPEDLAVQFKEEEKKKSDSRRKPQKLGQKIIPDQKIVPSTVESDANIQQSGFGINNLATLVTGVSHITKLVENTVVHEIGSKVLSGGLGTLENIGKKTMEVLQDGDPGLKKKRALLLGSNNKIVLSQVLREAKEKAETEDKKHEERVAARKCHFETLFDDFQGLVHLEALEMLSRQCELKLEQSKKSLPTSEVDEFEGILDEVKQLCEFDEDDSVDCSNFKSTLEDIVLPLKGEINLDRILEIHDGVEEWFEKDSSKSCGPKVINQKAISTLAELTAMTTHQFHKVGELLLVKHRRKTVEEADTLLQLTQILCKELNELSSKFGTCLMKKIEETKTEDDSLVTTLYVETANAESYIKQAFELLIPVLQLGAV